MAERAGNELSPQRGYTTYVGEAERRRVLVCDDERHIVRLIQVNLERQGYEVTAVLSGEAAIAQMEASEFELVILDDEMPGVTGGQVLQWIESRPEPRPRVIMLKRSKRPNLTDIFPRK